MTLRSSANQLERSPRRWRRLARPSVSPGLLRRFVSWCLTIPGRELENARLQEDKRRLERLLTIATALNDQHISTLEKVAGIGSVSGTNGKPGGNVDEYAAIVEQQIERSNHVFEVMGQDRVMLSDLMGD